VNKIIQALLFLLLLTLSYSVLADYEPWLGERESEWVLGHGYLAGKQIAPYPCLIIPSEAIKTQQKQLTFRFNYLKNEEDIDTDDIKFIERARRVVESTLNNQPKAKSYYALVLTITIEKEKRLDEPLLQLTTQSQKWLKAGDMLQFYRQCGTHYIQSAIVESSMRLWISYHPIIIEQAEKLQQLLSKNFPNKSVQDVTRLSWFKTLEKLNIGAIPSRLYMEGFGNGPIVSKKFSESVQPVNHTLITDWINQALLRIYQPQGGIIKKVQRLPWLSSYPAVATYCIHQPLTCDLKNFYLKNEVLETKKQRNRRYRFLAMMQRHKNNSLSDCYRLFSLLDTQTRDSCDQNRICHNCLKLLASFCGTSCQRHPDLFAFEPTQISRQIAFKQPILLGQAWNWNNHKTKCLATEALKIRKLPEQTVKTTMLYYPISHSSTTRTYQTHIDYSQRIGLNPNYWSLKPEIEKLGKGRAFFRACGSHYASEIRFSQHITFETEYNVNQTMKYKELKTNCDMPPSKLTISCPTEVTFRPWHIELYKEMNNIEYCSPKLSPEECWENINTE